MMHYHGTLVDVPDLTADPDVLVLKATEMDEPLMAYLPSHQALYVFLGDNQAVKMGLGDALLLGSFATSSEIHGREVA